MAIILYKPGNTYTSPKGIRCEFQICDPFSYEHLLDQGWFKTPEECYPKEKPKPKKDEILAKLRAEKAELLAKQNKE
jgi:hypothetical protein